MTISKNIKYIGVTDLNIDLFEGQYPVPEGMLYNSYIILDEKIAVLDTVDKNFGDEWLANLEKELAGKTPDYLVVHHMEPDHSANIKRFLDKYTNCKVLGSIVAFNMMKNFFGTDFSDRKVVVKDGDTLSLGSHTLTFVSAPLVHWPEVMFSYESSEKVLFSADAFGKFGCDKTTEDWACEARRYYFGIVGKFGGNVQNVLKKVSAFDIQTICPLHGPVLKENLGYYLGLYDIWSKYEVETEAVTICYTSVYGNTKEAVEYLNSFEQKQQNMTELTKNIVTGVGAIAFATVSAGTGLGLVAAAQAGAPIGAGIKTVLGVIDRMTNNVENDALSAKDVVKDAVSGAITGTTSAVSSGIMKGIKEASVAVSVKNGVKCGAMCGAISGSTSYLTDVALEDDKKFNFGELTTATATSSAISSLVGGSIGAGVFANAQLSGNVGKVIDSTTNEIIFRDSVFSSLRKIFGRGVRDVGSSLA